MIYVDPFDSNSAFYSIITHFEANRFVIRVKNTLNEKMIFCPDDNCLTGLYIERMFLAMVLNCRYSFIANHIFHTENDMYHLISNAFTKPWHEKGEIPHHIALRTDTYVHDTKKNRTTNTMASYRSQIMLCSKSSVLVGLERYGFDRFCSRSLSHR